VRLDEKEIARKHEMQIGCLAVEKIVVDLCSPGRSECSG